jgi:hypothetical protein
MMKKNNPQGRELSKVFDFLNIALRTVLVFLVFHINIFKNDIFGLKIKLLKRKTFKNFFLKIQNSNNLI